MSSYIFYEPYKTPFYFEFDRLLNNPSCSSSKQGKAGIQCPVRSFQPRLDLHEDTEKNIITATFEFPGFSKDDIQINFEHGNLTVSAVSQKSENNADTGYTLRERLRGKFSRTLQLPQGVKEEQIKASMANGVLIITFPKTLPELAPKKINITDVDSDYHKDFEL